MEVGFILIHLFIILIYQFMELTQDNLEYMTFVAREYCYPNKKQLVHEDDIKDAEELAELAATDIFKNRFPILKDEFKDIYENYQSNTDIQATLATYNLNPDKFWLLFLFITDFTNSCLGTIFKPEESLRTLSEKIVDIISNDKSLKITVSSNTRSISSFSPILLELLKESCSEFISKEYQMLDVAFCKIKKIDVDKIRTKKMKFFVTLFRWFLDKNITVHQPSKMSFIGRVLFLSKIVGEEKEYYNNSFRVTPITKGNKFLIKQHGTITINDKEYLKEPVDVGKDIADTIKKCHDYSPTNLSNYICAPLD